MAEVNYPRTTEVVEKMEIASQNSEVEELYSLNKTYEKVIVQEIAGHGRDVASGHWKELAALGKRKEAVREPHEQGLIKLMIEEHWETE